MNIDRFFAGVCVPLSLALVVFGLGCTTSKPPIMDTWCNPQFSPKRTDKIALTDQPNPAPQTKALLKLLVDELQSEGFQVVSPDRADYLLACVMDETVTTQPVVHTFVDYASLPHAQSDYQVAPSKDYVSIEQQQVGSFRFGASIIRLVLYTNPKTHHGDFQVAWQGNMNLNRSASLDQQQIFLKILLQYFGMQKNGPVIPASAQ